MAKIDFCQKPRLASVLPNGAFWPLHLTTFDQKPPRSRKCRSATASRLRLEKRLFEALAAGGFWCLRHQSLGETGFLGKFFVKFWANFCTLPREKIFERVAHEKGATRGQNRAISRENFRGGAFLAAPRAIFSRAIARLHARGQKPRRGDGFRALRARKIKIKLKNLILILTLESRARLMKTKAYLRNLKPISYGLCI